MWNQVVKKSVSSAIEPCFSARLVRPFLDLLIESPLASELVVARLKTLPDDERIPVGKVLRWLHAAEQLTGDTTLGLRAVSKLGRGAGDVLEFAASSAATFGEAMTLVLRYIRILNESAEFVMAVRDTTVCIDLCSKVPLTRPASDFQVGALVKGAQIWLGSIEGFEVWFAHAAPSDLAPYEAIFGAAKLRFGAANDALLFPTALLDHKLTGTDPALNAVLRRHADQLVGALPQNDQLWPRIRDLLLRNLESGDADAESVARKLGMSRRTLTRQLAQEGVSFRELLERARHQMALQYLEKTTLDAQQIAFLLGYTNTTSFARAFSRWRGSTPAEHRKAQRAQVSR